MIVSRSLLSEEIVFINAIAEKSRIFLESVLASLVKFVMCVVDRTITKRSALKKNATSVIRKDTLAESVH